MAKKGNNNTWTYNDYKEFNSAFSGELQNGADITPAHVDQLVRGMREDLKGREKLKSWEDALLRISEGDSSILELVAKKNEKLAFLVCLDQMRQKLTDAGFVLDAERPIGEQLAKLTDDKEFRRFAVRHATDPMFRKALHAAEKMTRGDDGAETEMSRKLAGADATLNKALMVRTLTPPTEEELQNLKHAMEAQGRGNEVLDTVMKNQEQQHILAKMLFMAHLAGTKIHSDDGQKNFDGNMCDLITHGGRVMVTLPAGNMQQEQFDAVLGSRNGDSAGVFDRVFATHSVTNTTLNPDGSVKSSGKEYKPLVTDIHNNYGMNLSVGGLGANGVQDVTVQPDGTNGHAYMKLVPGGGRTCGMMLFGVESSAPGKSSQLGKAHDGKAIKSKQSAFLSHKNVQGNTYGGRTIDFSQMDGETFVSLMHKFDNYYSELQKHPANLETFNKTLCGKPMGEEALRGFLTMGLKIDSMKSREIVDQLRTDHVAHFSRVGLEDEKVKAPEQPNFFKRWFQSMNQSWRKENEAYEAYVKEQQAARIRRQNELEDTLNKLSPAADKGELKPARTVISDWADVANSAQNPYDRDRALAAMLYSINLAASKKGSLTGVGEVDIPAGTLSEAEAEKVMNSPTFRYLMADENTGLRRAASWGGVNDASKEERCEVLAATLKNIKDNFTLLPWEAKDGKKQTEQMKELFNELNVPGLAKRSREYQELVAAVERAANSENPNPEDSIRVFNAVRAYADAKSTVPSTAMGKKSLSLAYKALDAALPPHSRKGLTEEMKSGREALERAMGAEKTQPAQPGL